MKKLYLIPVLMLAAFVACQEPEQPVKEELSLVNTTLTIPVEGDIVSIEFNSTVDWKAESDSDWLTLSPDKGQAGEKCVVKASATRNESNDPRTAKVTITAGAITGTVTLTQAQTNALNVATAEYTVDAEGGNVEVTVSANVDYEVVIPEAIDWVHNATTKGLVDSKVNLTVDASYDVEPRSAVITIKADGLSSTVTIAQAAFEPYYDMELPEGVGMFSGFGDGNPLVLAADATSFTINVSTNMEHYCYFAPWDASVGAAVETNDVGWIKFEYDNEKIVFTIEPNEGYIPREEYFYSGCFVGDIDFGAYGSCILIRQDGLVPQAGANVLWTKKLSDISADIKPGYNRLAYKTAGGDALLLSDGEKVHVMSPADGTYWKAIQWTNIKPTSICSDEDGVIVAAEDIPFSTGSHYTIYYTENVNEDPVALIEHDADFDGTLGSIRVRGKLADRAVVTGFITGNRYWAGWEIDKKQISMDNYYAQSTGGQARGPIAVDADAWTPEAGAVMSLGPRLNDGIVYRAYDTDQRLYYLSDAYTPNWLTPYDWKVICEAGAGGNECQNNMDIIDYQGRRIMAYTQGLYWGYGGNANVYFIDVTNPGAAEVIAILDASNLASVDSYAVGEDYGWATLNAYISADVKLHVEEDLGLVCYIVNSTLESLSKALIVF